MYVNFEIRSDPASTLYRGVAYSKGRINVTQNHKVTGPAATYRIPIKLRFTLHNPLTGYLGTDNNIQVKYNAYADPYNHVWITWDQANTQWKVEGTTRDAATGVITNHAAQEGTGGSYTTLIYEGSMDVPKDTLFTNVCSMNNSPIVIQGCNQVNNTTSYKACRVKAQVEVRLDKNNIVAVP